MPEAYRTRISPRWSDQDLNGHVNHAAVVTLLEESRLKWRATMQGVHSTDVAPTVVAALELSYRRPIHYGEDLDVELAVSRIGTSSVDLEFTGTQNGAVAVEGRTVLVSVWPETGKSRPLAERERYWLAQFQPTPANTEPREPQIPDHPPLELTQ
ncbi:acyl-CoA thioesterase [Arthrobacter sp. H16F315]|uniref:acyl-CoA thioesterase n=1 Tax=Arthrobacter sp. H16F315 TaxID=2955314 RepID=UPI002097CC88|nr:thioesterase family protein [Arthrobacter sp. H16F315]MDD1476382.1 thioesterase family protein [Arthrobacter sp. H16F315]